MADTYTSNYNLDKPEVGGSDDSWGDKLNQNFDKIDKAIKSNADDASDAYETIGINKPSNVSIDDLNTGKGMGFRVWKTGSGTKNTGTDEGDSVTVQFETTGQTNQVQFSGDGHIWVRGSDSAVSDGNTGKDPKDWKDWKKLVTGDDFDPKYDAIPVGCIQMYAGKRIPSGWLKCDGAKVDKSKYPQLYDVVGANLPDMRGRFARGADDGSKRVDGGDDGPMSYQEDTYKKHNHSVSLDTDWQGRHSHDGSTNNAGDHNHNYKDRFNSFRGRDFNEGYRGNGHDNKDGWIASGTSDSGGNANLPYMNTTTDNGGSHSHSFTTSTQDNHKHTVKGDTGTSGSGETRPKAMTVYYIIRAK